MEDKTEEDFQHLKNSWLINRGMVTHLVPLLNESASLQVSNLQTWTKRPQMRSPLNGYHIKNKQTEIAFYDFAPDRKSLDVKRNWLHFCPDVFIFTVWAVYSVSASSPPKSLSSLCKCCSVQLLHTQWLHPQPSECVTSHRSHLWEEKREDGRINTYITWEHTAGLEHSCAALADLAAPLSAHLRIGFQEASLPSS